MRKLRCLIFGHNLRLWMMYDKPHKKAEIYVCSRCDKVTGRLNKKKSNCCKSIFDKVINPSNKRYFLNRCRECGKYCKPNS